MCSPGQHRVLLRPAGNRRAWFRRIDRPAKSPRGVPGRPSAKRSPKTAFTASVGPLAAVAQPLCRAQSAR